MPVIYKLFRNLLIVVVGVVALIALTAPLGVRFSLKHYLYEMGAERVEIDGVHVNLLSGFVELKDVEAEVSGHQPLLIERLTIDVPYWHLINSELTISKVALRGVRASVDQRADGLLISGLTLPTGSESSEVPSDSEPVETDSPSSFIVSLKQLKLDDIQLSLTNPTTQLNLALDHFVISNLSNQPQQPAEVEIALDVEVELKSDAGPMTLALKQLVLQITAAAGPLTADQWPSVSIDATLTTQSTQIRLPQGLAVAVGPLSWPVTVTLPSDAEQTWQESLKIETSLGVDQLEIALSEPSQSTLTVASLAVDGVVVDGLQQIVVESIVVGDYQLATSGVEQAHVPLSGQSITVQAIRVDDQSRIAIDKIQMAAFKLDIVRDADGRLAGLPAAEEKMDEHSPEGASTSVDAADEPSGTNLFWQVNEIALASIDIQFKDQSVAPPFSTEVHSDKVTIGPIGNSSDVPNTMLDAQFVVDKYGAIELAGYVRPLDSSVTAKLDVQVKNLELVPVSPYVAQALGYHVRTGKLDSDIDINATNNQLDSLAKLSLSNIKLEPVSDELIENLNKQLTMPLDVALSSIRDSDNNIHLEIPVTGNVSSPDFNLNDAVQQATVKATQALAIRFLKTALEPYTTMINVMELAYEGGKKLSALKLDPVTFAGAEVAISASGLDYLGKIQQVLAERPDLRLSVCGVSYRDKPTGDQAAVDAQSAVNPALLQQAVDRAQVVKDQLVSGGIEPQRLFSCQAKVVERPEEVPAEQSGHVDLVL